LEIDVDQIKLGIGKAVQNCVGDYLHKDGPEFQLWLKNTQTLYGVENLAIAPGYQELQD
jgi:hypothetical protein